MSITEKIKAIILSNEDKNQHLSWVNACKAVPDKIEFAVVDITSIDWLDRILSHKPDVCLLKPSGHTSIFRTLYQERVDILVNELNISVFPSFAELKIYENKRYFSYWAYAHRIPIPQTYVIYTLEEAKSIANAIPIPVVCKINVGASGNGVKIIKRREELFSYLEKAYSKGIRSRTGPNFKKGKFVQRICNKLINYSDFKNKLAQYAAIANDKQVGFVIIQEYIPHKFEWRVVRIGDSFFAHKKVKIGEKASGTLKKKYDNPPLQLLDFVKTLTDKHVFLSVAVDIFESSNEGYLVNEIQCIFGQSDEYQMKVDGKIGRYVSFNNKWTFEEGDYAKNACYDLRIKHVMSVIK